MTSRTVIVGVAVALIVVALTAAFIAHRSTPAATTTTITPTQTASPTATTTTQTTTTTTTATQAASPTPSMVVVTGSGSSFIAPQLYAWAQQVKNKYPWLVVEYESVGSGAGVSNFLQKVRDFGATDPPLPRDKWEQNKGKVIQMPVIMGPIAVIYNIPGVTVSLNLTAEVLAGIYRGDIKYWDDPAIASLNPNVKLPHQEIIVVHRSDASGTTEVFTTFLNKAAPNLWPSTLVGKTVNWPVDATGRGVGAKGNEGVTQTVKTTPYSIGYVEWSYALDAGLPMAALKNPRGEFVTPSVEAVQRAVAAVQLPASPLDDFTPVVGQIVYADSPGAYPLVSFSFLVFWTEYPRDKAEAIKTFIQYINTEGQSTGNIVKGYVPIPEQVRQLNLKALNLIQAKG